MSRVVEDEKRERVMRVVAVASLLTSSIYLGWRWAWTLDPSALWFSVPLVLAECYGLLMAALLTSTAWKLRRRDPIAPPPGRSVDVFVMVAGDPLATIRTSVLAARDIPYPHTTWLLDDARRDELQAAADEFGIRYLRRDSPADGDSGTLNHALARSRGEFILLLDADQAALPQAVDRLLGEFADDRMAFVQSSQRLHPADGDVDDGRGDQPRWSDQHHVSDVLQQGNDRGNAAIFEGGCALVRRAALDDIGGFAGRTTAMGIESSLLLHARGWRSAYVGEALASGLAPATAQKSRVEQRRRARGAMQLLRLSPPLALHGLSRFQRLAYLHMLATPLGSVQRLILYLTPIVILTTGVFPVRASVGAFAAFFLPAAVLRAVSHRLLTRGHRSLMQADRDWMAAWFPRLLAIRAFVAPRRPSGDEPLDRSDTIPVRAVAPQLTLIALTALALAWTAYARTRGYGVAAPGWGVLALFGAVLAALWHAGLAAYVVQQTLAPRHTSIERSLPESLPVDERVLHAPWYAAVSRLVAKARATAAVGTGAVRSAVARGGRSAAETSQVAATLLSAGTATAAADIAAGSRAAVDRASAMSRSAAERLAVESRAALVKAAGAARLSRRATPPAGTPWADGSPVGGAASDPERTIEMQIDGEFSFPFELTVGATLLVSASGRLTADIATVHAIVLGRYEGTLRATRTIRIGPGATVDGALDAPEVVIEEGAIVTPPRTGVGR